MLGENGWQRYDRGRSISKRRAIKGEKLGENGWWRYDRGRSI